MTTEDTASSTPRKAGRRGDSAATRNEILTAACDRFGEVGYEATTIRSVATQAGVDPALVMHYFKNKDGLFHAVVGTLIALPGRLDEARSLEDFIEVYFRQWEDPETGPRLRAIVRGGIGSEHAAELLKRFISQQFQVHILTAPFADIVFHTPESRRRVPYLGSMLLGTAITRYIVGIPQLAEPSTKNLAARLAPAAAALLTDDGPFRRQSPAG